MFELSPIGLICLVSQQTGINSDNDWDILKFLTINTETSSRNVVLKANTPSSCKVSNGGCISEKRGEKSE